MLLSTLSCKTISVAEPINFDSATFFCLLSASVCSSRPLICSSLKLERSISFCAFSLLALAVNSVKALYISGIFLTLASESNSAPTCVTNGTNPCTIDGATPNSSSCCLTGAVLSALSTISWTCSFSVVNN